MPDDSLLVLLGTSRAFQTGRVLIEQSPGKEIYKCMTSGTMEGPVQYFQHLLLARLDILSIIDEFTQLNQ